jgi:hypothetical protein
MATFIFLGMALLHPLVVFTVFGVMIPLAIIYKLACWHERHPGYGWIWYPVALATPLWLGLAGIPYHWLGGV